MNIENYTIIHRIYGNSKGWDFTVTCYKVPDAIEVWHEDTDGKETLIYNFIRDEEMEDIIDLIFEYLNNHYIQYRLYSDAD